MEKILYQNEKDANKKIKSVVVNNCTYLMYTYSGQVFSGLYLEEPLKDSYVLTPVLLSIYNDSKKVLILGAGCGTFTILLEKLNGNIDVTMVDIDSDAPYLSKKYFNVNLDKYKFIVQDAYEYIRNCKEKFDLIIVDVFNENGIPYEFTTISFFQDIMKCLGDNGIMVMNTNMKTVAPIEKIFPEFINPIYTLYKNIKEVGFKSLYENNLTNSSFIFAFKNLVNQEELEKFYLSIIKNYDDINVKATAYGNLFRTKEFTMSNSAGIRVEEQIKNISLEYKSYIRKIIYKLLRCKDISTMDDSVKESLTKIYLHYLTDKIKGKMFLDSKNRYNSLFDIYDINYYREVINNLDNINIKANSLLKLSNYISTAKMRLSILSDNNSIVYHFLKGICDLREDKGAEAFIHFRNINLNNTDIRG